MDTKKLAESLSENEILVLKNLKAKATARELEQSTGLIQVEVIRALQWLDNKKLVKLKKEEKEIIDLGKLGQEYISKGLPERNLLKHLLKLKAIRFEDAQKRIGMSKEELQAALGALKKKLLVAIEHGRIILKVSADEANKKTLEEKFLEALPLEKEILTPENKFAFNELRRRKEIVDVKKKSIFSAQITDTGKKVLQALPKGKMIETITPDLLKGDEWKKAKFKRYDVAVRVPEIYGGKRQAYYAFLSDVKKELIRLGFKEMKGPTVESEFWNFDALFQPQFHVARDWSATYYANVSVKLPSKEIVNAVKRQHEKSWQYKWQLEKAKKAILRPQGTSLSVRTLANKPEIPGKYFAIARCYRPDVIDAQHLAEFNQVEGIILDKDINFIHLLGQLKQFAEVFAPGQEIKFIPDYYPFTEPSVQLSVKHPKIGWIEIGGAGIFREEVTKPLGIDVPVIAWGLGIDRLAMFKLNVKDIRMLFSHDLEWLREAGA
ncbi:phenylalanine--tRNA ligase subunit alpha [Candidatus Pacearchaeota archaeon ex4484_26]|nr:MAG: phenylalanine--tRNA ligase subunit alpha [Candidatus Pacearchaeota archaeon ex4484_26]